MAHYSTTIRTDLSPEAAFDYMADLRNFEEWDPGVSSSKLVVGSAPGAGAEYDVKVSATTLRYVTKEYTSPTRTVVEAKSALLRSYDVIEIRPDGDGCTVRYDATLELNGVLKLADPLLGLIFKQIGDRARRGMRKALDGKVVA